MNSIKRLALLVTAACLQASPALLSAQGAELSLRAKPTGLELSWTAVRQRNDGAIERPWFELGQSIDLKSRRPVGGPWLRHRVVQPAPQGVPGLLGQTMNFPQPASWQMGSRCTADGPEHQLFAIGTHA